MTEHQDAEQLRARLEALQQSPEAIELRRLQTQLDAVNAEIAAQLDARLRDRIEAKVAAVKIPALRPYIRALYQWALAGGTTFDVELLGAKLTGLTPVQVTERLMEELNAKAHVFFPAASKLEENPAAAVAARVSAYRVEHPDATYEAAMKAVLDADPDLKTAYAGS